MLPLWTIAEIKDALEIDSPLEGEISAVSINSQETQKGDLFIPLRGDQHDAHKFIGDAFKKGAAAALVDHVPPDIPLTSNLLKVKDTYQALLDLAHHARLRTKAKVIGVTGSFGKTTTKEMLNLILSDQGTTSASVKSFNNHWGVPLSLCRLPQEAKYGIFEVGMNHTGEIATLVKILKPSIALITDVAPVHLSNFRDLEEIVNAKTEIFQEMTENGCAVLNRDSSTFDQQMKRASHHGIKRIITFGKHSEATLRLESIIDHPDRQEAHFSLEGQSYSFTLKARGEHWVMNALAALAVTAGAGGNVSQACQSIEKFDLLDGRGKQYRVRLPLGGEFTIIDESYNSNPIALKKALNTLGGFPLSERGRRIAVLGDMYELGGDSVSIHQDISADIEAHRIDRVYTSGQDIAALFQNLPSIKQGFHHENVEPVAKRIWLEVRAGDIILIKGSRGGGPYPRMRDVLVKLLEKAH